MFLSTLFLSFVLFSCSQDEEVYSCNQEVNDWVKQHKSYIQSLNRSQWHELNISVAKPSYSAFTPSQKIAFWKDKFDEVKTLDWSKMELDHIQMAEDYIMQNTHYFRDEKLSEEEYDEIETFCAKWIRTGERDFAWSKKTAFGIIGTGFKMIDKEGNIFIPHNVDEKLSSPVMRTAREVDCNCNIGSVLTCLGDPFGFCEKSKLGCSVTSLSCGVLWIHPCNGTCGGV